MESLRGSRGQGTAVRVSRGLSFGWKTLRSEDRPSAFRVTLSGALETWYSFTWELREGTYQVSGPGGRVRANAEARSSVFEVIRRNRWDKGRGERGERGRGETIPEHPPHCPTIAAAPRCALTARHRRASTHAYARARTPRLPRGAARRTPSQSRVCQQSACAHRHCHPTACAGTPQRATACPPSMATQPGMCTTTGLHGSERWLELCSRSPSWCAWAAAVARALAASASAAAMRVRQAEEQTPLPVPPESGPDSRRAHFSRRRCAACVLVLPTVGTCAVR